MFIASPRIRQEHNAQESGGWQAEIAVLAALEGEGVRVESLTIARPSLDDVYLRYTGRAFEQADREGSGAPSSWAFPLRD